MDPLTKEYPWNSTYAFAENDVIRSIDLEGLEKCINYNIRINSDNGKAVLTNKGSWEGINAKNLVKDEGISYKFDDKGTYNVTKEWKDNTGWQFLISHVPDPKPITPNRSFSDILSDVESDMRGSEKSYNSNERWVGTKGFYDKAVPFFVNTASAFLGGYTLKFTVGTFARTLTMTGIGFDVAQAAGVDKALEGTKFEIPFKVMNAAADATGLVSGALNLKKQQNILNVINTLNDLRQVTNDAIDFTKKKKK